MALLTLLLVLGTTVWVGFDASGRDWSGFRLHRLSRGGWSTTWWVIACLLGWVVVFPLYLLRRGSAPLKETVYQPGPATRSSGLGSVADSLLSGAYAAGERRARAAVAAFFERFPGGHPSPHGYGGEWECKNSSFSIDVQASPAVTTRVWIETPIEHAYGAAVEELCSLLNWRRRLSGLALDHERRLVVNTTHLDCVEAGDSISDELVRNAVSACIYGATVAAAPVTSVIAGTLPQAALEAAADDSRLDYQVLPFDEWEQRDAEAALIRVVREAHEYGEWYSSTGERWQWREGETGNQFVIEAMTDPEHGVVAYVDVEGPSIATTTYLTDSFDHVPPERVSATRELCSLLTTLEVGGFGVVCGITPGTAGVYTRTWTTFNASPASMTRQVIDNCIRGSIACAGIYEPAVNAVVLDGVPPSEAIRRYLPRPPYY